MTRADGAGMSIVLGLFTLVFIVRRRRKFSGVIIRT
jgi:uncharacterized protein (TIGR03382 family)